MLVQDSILEPIFGQNSTTAITAVIPYRFCELYSFGRIMFIVFLCFFFVISLAKLREGKL
jgi:hypothetical protein